MWELARGAVALSQAPLQVSQESVRRLAVTKQHLAGKLPSRATSATLLNIVRDLAYVQWDPVPIVAPSHVISFWSRVGRYRLSDLEDLLWKDRRLLLHWIPIASIVRTDDYPIFASLNHRYPGSMSRSWGRQRDEAKRFLARHADLRRTLLKSLKGGPLRANQLPDHAQTKRADSDWNPSSDVALLLYHLMMRGEVMVVGHEGAQNLWGLTDRFLPRGTDRTVWSEERLEREAAQRALRALGTASPREIHLYFPRGRYQHLPATLEALEKESVIHRVTVEGLGPRDVRYIHAEDLPLLESLGSSAWRPRMSLLPPFDNMLSDPGRASRLFNFEYVREQFLPAAKRRFGTYVLPILWGDRFIGRIDPQMDRESGTLRIHSVHAEADAPADAAVADEVAASISGLAAFLGARRVTYTSRVPPMWRASLR